MSTAAGVPAASDRPEEEAVIAAAAHVSDRLGGSVPPIGIALGSGLGELVGRIGNAVRVPYGEIPGWPIPTVEGHAGELVSGRLGETPIVAFAGRVHMYEGPLHDRTSFYVRVFGQLGGRALLLSNAAGAINRGFSPGELILVADHINKMLGNPLIGPALEGEARFPDMYDAYDSALRNEVRTAAREIGLLLREGVYAAVAGPSYETPAEVRMLARLGADAVGMSTVPEVIAAQALGIRCVAVSCLTNSAAGTMHEPLDHADVIAVGHEAADDFERLVTRAVERIARGLAAT